LTKTSKQPSFNDLGAYAAELAESFGLRDWTIVFKCGVDGDEMANCLVSENRRNAVITFSNEWHTWDTQVLKATVVHELLHCHWAQVEHLDHNLQYALGIHLWNMHQTAFNSAHEYAIDTVSECVARLMPDPKWAV
jgi:hypothetical protein